MSSYLAGCGVSALTGEGRGDALWGLLLTFPSHVSQTQQPCTDDAKMYYMEWGAKFDKLLANSIA